MNWKRFTDEEPLFTTPILILLETGEVWKAEKGDPCHKDFNSETAYWTEFVPPPAPPDPCIEAFKRLEIKVWKRGIWQSRDFFCAGWEAAREYFKA